MSDLASPLIYIYDNEVGKAFWCFVQVMKLIVSVWFSTLIFTQGADIWVLSSCIFHTFHT